ncbi:hypothetical protein BU24DRAFT_426107 [Aaosphaeria arxii CBS 175.79]|uniref:Uncharacterized protein n=1 Tax=Aaosphaeria arxii CBS 175.79 TaxID=1450172 RepID=A0A6A5XHC8_9PLEO|nr:uncharacterized protein BU24DRAFT_426107 [Aaosphaeria arxii CBS 175.79]KAF2012256.1 hypothetical protein BU24DRAFT_426107 [Aaosphaeria arxii CBS 175.79]
MYVLYHPTVGYGSGKQPNDAMTENMTSQQHSLLHGTTLHFLISPKITADSAHKTQRLHRRIANTKRGRYVALLHPACSFSFPRADARARDDADTNISIIIIIIYHHYHWHNPAGIYLLSLCLSACFVALSLLPRGTRVAGRQRVSRRLFPYTPIPPPSPHSSTPYPTISKEEGRRYVLFSPINDKTEIFSMICLRRFTPVGVTWWSTTGKGK